MTVSLPPSRLIEPPFTPELFGLTDAASNAGAVVVRQNAAFDATRISAATEMVGMRKTEAMLSLNI